MTTLPFMDGFEQFRDPNISKFKSKLQMAGWGSSGNQIAPGSGRYGDMAIVCKGSTFWRDLPNGVYFGVAVNKSERGQIMTISGGGDTMVIYTSRLDGFAYVDGVSLDAIPLNNLWYYYEVGVVGGSLIVRINDRQLGSVPLKPGIAAAGTVRVEFGATTLVPPPQPGEQIGAGDQSTASYDDFYAVSSGFLGTVTVSTRLPTGVWEDEWQVSGAPNAQRAVGEMPFDEMNRYIAEEIAGNTTAFVSNKIIQRDYPILATGLVMVARKPDNLARAIEVSISQNNGHVTPRSRVVQVGNAWDMHYIQFSQNPSDTPELLQASPFAVKLVDS